uniref:Uncharacterized protein n=1 Tax=Caenorhabditis japonica TaxID=281687 RepID=A0A8R1INS9_CAEJA
MLTLPHVTFQSTIVYYTISAVLLCEWYSPLSAGLIGWSIIGFFKNHSASNVVHHSDGSLRKVSRPV